MLERRMKKIVFIEDFHLSNFLLFESMAKRLTIFQSVLTFTLSDSDSVFGVLNNGDTKLSRRSLFNFTF